MAYWWLLQSSKDTYKQLNYRIDHSALCVESLLKIIIIVNNNLLYECKKPLLAI